MCTSPIRILNRKYRWLKPDTPRKYIVVPCGCCDECLRRRAADLYVRAQYEYLSCIKHGGIGFMCCLTYSNSLLPYFEHEGHRYMVFNKQDVINFIKRLRVTLDRYYKRHYNTIAPDFKYLVSSEYGTDPMRTHRPHYHLLFFFRENIPFRLFRWAFSESTYNRKNGTRYFGIIKQCEVIDRLRGGIRYSAKYVLKDLMFEEQRKIITNYINFEKDAIEQEFGIVSFPQSPGEEFRNKCIRCSKEYRHAVSARCLPYRHMLQFYLCSNDFGVSAIFERYGDGLASLPVLSLGGFSFALPKAVKSHFADKFGALRASDLSKAVFRESVRVAGYSLASENKILFNYVNKLLDFVDKFVYYDSGFPYLSTPDGSHYCLFDSFEFPSYDTKDEEYRFMEDNDFFTLRDDLLFVIRLYNSPQRLALRRKLAFEKSLQEKSNYEQKKRNRYASL